MKQIRTEYKNTPERAGDSEGVGTDASNTGWGATVEC